MDTEAGPGKRRISLSDVESHLRAARSSVEDLLRAVRSLPDVDEEGHSECHFAEELFAAKEEREVEVRGLLSRLQQDQSDVQWLMKACKNDMVVVAAQEDKLHGDRAREHFSEAQVKLAAKYRCYRQLLKKIKTAIRLLGEALHEASAKKFPGKIPQKWPGLEDSAPPLGKDQHPLDVEPTGADKELDDLFELDRRQQFDEHADE
ncbi:MAG: hypothetical protein NTV86_00915 [Planctomycetota bacterium]|nr:hypothetical protein [Planctomycetota bacterium]